jgi:uncharacterized delta-60 repeat protein/RHS repeat-associated protein
MIGGHTTGTASAAEAETVKLDEKWRKARFSEPTLRCDSSNFCGTATSYRLDANSSGKLTTTVGSTDVAWCDLVQSDGKILVIGANSGAGVVIRYNADGSLDSSFGSSGVSSISGVWLYDAAIQSDGKIVVVGNDNWDFVALRLNTDGTIDTSFGTSGYTTIDFGGNDYAAGVALAPDGKIVMVGITGGLDWAVVRLTTGGALDTTFNSTGKTTLDWGGTDWAKGVTVQSTGKIVVVGTQNGVGGVARFNVNGSLDTSFGPSGTGKILLSSDYTYRPTIQSLSDDRLLVSGVESGEVSLHRFTADGLVDSSFGTSGVVLTSLGATDYGYDLAVQGDGKIVEVGGSYSDSTNSDGLAVRYNVDGSLDTSFGTAGKMLIWYGSSSYSESDYFYSVAIQADGQIIAVGSAADKFAVARMNGGLTRLYAQQDANYNVTSVVDVSGNVKERFVYTPYGVVTVLTAAWASTSDSYVWQYTFQDGRYDLASGDTIYNNRVYGANTGTWLRPDPIGYWDGMDKYRFVYDAPISHRDPDGLAGWGWLGPGAWVFYNLPYDLFVWNYKPPSDDQADGDDILIEFFNGVGPRDRYFGPNSWMTKVIKDAGAVNSARDKARANLKAALNKAKCCDDQPKSLPEVKIIQDHTNPLADIPRMMAARASYGRVGNMGFVGGYLGTVTFTKVGCGHYKMHFHIDNTTSSTSGGGSGPDNRAVQQHWDWDEDYYANGTIG